MAGLISSTLLNLPAAGRQVSNSFIASIISNKGAAGRMSAAPLLFPSLKVGPHLYPARPNVRELVGGDGRYVDGNSFGDPEVVEKPLNSKTKKVDFMQKKCYLYYQNR